MSATKSKRPTNAPRRPEKKYGPFHGGVGVAIWLNQIQTDDGPRFFRSVTIASRRYRDEDSGEWRDAGSLRSTDLAALILGLEAARDFIASTPLPGEAVEEEHAEEPAAPADGTEPF